ncbi:MAG: YeeE/YedE family protein [Gammaproteobacteria bacterium]
MEWDITHQILASAWALAFVLGVIVRKTGFCTLGAVSDWINMGHMGRLAAWFLAMAVAITGVLILEMTGMVDMSSTLPPYRSSTFMWPRYILGGLMFGVGMTLASGCGNMTSIRMGGGNIKSLVVFTVMGGCAYLMTKTNFYGYVFHSWMEPISINLAAYGIESQEISVLVASLLGMEPSAALRWILGGAAALAIFTFVFRSPHFRERFDFLLGGGTVGVLVVVAWYITGSSIGAEWKEFAEFMDQPPIGVATQSLTFINPTGEWGYWYTQQIQLEPEFAILPIQWHLISFGMMVISGVVFGSFFYSVFTRKFHFEWFRSWGDFFNHALGGALMGIGGVLAMGCSIGQGVTGVSTMALGSFIALGGIILGSALTMKVAYYKMVYEEEANFGSALLSSLVDLRLLPKGLRKLEAV